MHLNTVIPYLTKKKQIKHSNSNFAIKVQYLHLINHIIYLQNYELKRKRVHFKIIKLLKKKLIFAEYDFPCRVDSLSKNKSKINFIKSSNYYSNSYNFGTRVIKFKNV